MRPLAIAVLLFACLPAFAQTDKFESLAQSKIMAANIVPNVTIPKCLTVAMSWHEKDESARNSWVEKLSTEELRRLTAEGIACGNLIRQGTEPSDQRIAD